MPPDTRPTFLNLLAIHMPIGAVTSILHRITGVLLFLTLPLAAYLLEYSLRSESGFVQVGVWLSTLPARVVIFVLSWALLHHLFAGIRFLLLDLEWGMSRTPARRMAWAAVIAAPIAALVFVWGLG